jgi:hypothetical protein
MEINSPDSAYETTAAHQYTVDPLKPFRDSAMMQAGSPGKMQDFLCGKDARLFVGN